MDQVSQERDGFLTNVEREVALIQKEENRELRWAAYEEMADNFNGAEEKLTERLII